MFAKRPALLELSPRPAVVRWLLLLDARSILPPTTRLDSLAGTTVPRPVRRALCQCAMLVVPCFLLRLIDEAAFFRVRRALYHEARGILFYAWVRGL